MKRSNVLAGPAAALLLFALAGAAAAQEPKAQPEAEAPRVYVVMVRSDPDKMYVLEKTKVQKLGDVSFLTGRLSGTIGPADWRVGATLWLPLSEITQLSEYPGMAEVQRAHGVNFNR